MHFIQGRGRARRTVITIPTGELVRNAPKDQQDQVLSLVCGLTGVPVASIQPNA
jgi:hypothetical protein